MVLGLGAKGRQRVRAFSFELSLDLASDPTRIFPDKKKNGVGVSILWMESPLSRPDTFSL